MTKCTICKKNAAVVFTTRFENGKRFNEGLCLKCAYKNGLNIMDDMFSKAGISDDNIDEITEKINQVMDHSDINSPEKMLRSIVEGSFDSDPIFLDISDQNEADTEDEERMEAVQNNMIPAAMAHQNNEQDENAKESDHEKTQRIIPDKETTKKDKDKKKRYLDQFGINLNNKATEGKIDRIVGRNNEIDRVVQILNRRSKNNPVLLGEPGVGKTAIAEGLAVRIVEGNVPVKLRNLEVYLLDMTAMVAGTQFRGQFESRMKGVVEEAKRCENIIIVIDELHNIMGAGDAEGAMNAANILKPALAKGEIRVLGSTTTDEYRRFIEKDSALERRFQQVFVEEPTKEETLEILQGVKDYYEKHHKVIYDDQALYAAVSLSDRYITDRFLPDKAIDLLDEAGSKANLNDIHDMNIFNSLQRITSLENEQEYLENQLIENNLDTGLLEKEAQVKSELCREHAVCIELQNEYKPVRITAEDIAAVVEMWTKIPVQRISETESAKLLSLEKRLHERVIGQDDAVTALAKSIRRNRAGFRKKHKPSSFIFVGPTGVGKTELVKALAWAMFESEDAMIRLDMSEFMEPHTVSKLIGSPPGYVGFDDGGQLTEKVRRKPYSVLLLDEIEKAHADVFNMLLQILDDGRLTDSHGRMINFENTIIVMTSNAGTTLKAQGIGFGGNDYISLEKRVHGVLKEIFRPEFLNRVDDIIVFRELTQTEIRQICDLMMKDIIHTLTEKNIKLIITDEAKDFLSEKGYDPKFGARPLRKTLQKEIEDPLADKLLRGDLKDVIAVSVVLRDRQIGFEFL
jgi:ATP-dependent Clp protease ATP-binding subunit ClpC